MGPPDPPHPHSSPEYRLVFMTPDRAPVVRAVSLAGALALALLLPPGGAAGAHQGWAERRFVARDGSPLPLSTHEAVVDFLTHADVVETEELPTGTTQPHRVTLTRDELTLRAIFRAVDVDREALRTRDGAAYAAFYDRAIHELAAYRLAMALGIDMIPPVVERRLLGSNGTLQLWIEGAMTETERVRQKLQPPRVGPWRRQHQIMRVFDALVHNSDRNTGNRLIDGDWNLWMIDHTRTFQRPRGRTQFPRVNQLPAPLWDKLRNLGEDELRALVESYVEPLQIASLLARHRALVGHIERLIEERGADAVLVE